MNPISAFFVRNIISVFFFYGLAFFIMGVALLLAGRQSSEFKFARAIRPLAFFGILHGMHEWFEMYQKIAALSSGYRPAPLDESIRLAILLLSFVMLLAFGIILLDPNEDDHKNQWPLVGMVGLWGLSLAVVNRIFQLPPSELIALADVLLRYSLGIPGALLGTWALMAQQRTFREHNMPQFGRDLVWCAAALFLYGVVGQVFVRQTLLVPSTIINSALFLQWFGIPVQLFRGIMAAVLTFYMVRALRAFDLETRRRLEQANQAQAQALAAERRLSQEMEQLNEELRLAAHELSLLLDLSNLLARPMSLEERLRQVLAKIVHNFDFSERGMIVLANRHTDELDVQASTGFPAETDDNPASQWAFNLGKQCVEQATVVCRHADAEIFEISLSEMLQSQECRKHPSPTIMIALPLTAQQEPIGSIVLAQTTIAPTRQPTLAELHLMSGIAQQLGLSIENARLYQEAQQREKTLAELLHQVVGAQEAERQRIARELHDATGQSLTAIGLGLRGIESLLLNNISPKLEQIREIKSYSTNALKELRQIIADLRPSQLDDLGLVPALRWYAQSFEKRRAISTEVVLKGEEVRLPQEYEAVLFRITQEALTNIAKHANATEAVITLEMFLMQIRLTIEDNGCGFDPDKTAGDQTGWGLLGIKERTTLLGGQYEIDSTPGQGTMIQITIPLIGEMTNVED